MAMEKHAQEGKSDQCEHPGSTLHKGRRPYDKPGAGSTSSLVCFATWQCNKEGAEQALPLCEVVEYFFNAGCRIHCGKQQIQVYFDITTRRFASLINKFWPTFLELKLWNWEYYPGIA